MEKNQFLYIFFIFLKVSQKKLVQQILRRRRLSMIVPNVAIFSKNETLADLLCSTNLSEAISTLTMDTSSSSMRRHMPTMREWVGPSEYVGKK